MQIRDNILENIHCIYLNFRKLDDAALSKLDKAHISNTEKTIEEFKQLQDFRIEQLAIVKKCNAIMLIIIAESVNESHFEKRILSSWDKLSKGGISSFRNDIRFKKGKDALMFIAEASVGIHSLVIGDSQVYGQITGALSDAVQIQQHSPFLKNLSNWLQSLNSEVKAQTKLFEGNTSIERITCELITTKHLDIKSVLVIGLGMSGQLVAKIISEETKLNLSVCNRTLSESVEEFVKKINTKFLPIDEIINGFNADALIIAIDSQSQESKEFAAQLVDILNKSNKENNYCFDICSPPLINQSTLSSKIKLLNISDLTKYAQNTINKRENEINKAKQIIQKSINNFENEIKKNVSKIRYGEQKNNITKLTDKQIEIYKIRHHALSSIRTFLINENFIEIQTPYIVGVSIEPLNNAVEKVIEVGFPSNFAFLRQSNQFYKQIIVASGIEKIFEVGPFWRSKRKKSKRHLEEAIGLDVEMLEPENLEYIYLVAFRLIKNTYEHFLNLNIIESNKLQIPDEKNLPIITYAEAIEILNSNNYEISYGDDFGINEENQLGIIAKEMYGSDVIIVKKYPDTMKKFYTLKNSDGTTESFDIILCGWKVCSGSIRETDRNMIERSMELSSIPTENYDFYLSIISEAKPHGGFGLSFDRLVGKLLSCKSIEEVVVFPRTFENLIP